MRFLLAGTDSRSDGLTANDAYMISAQALDLTAQGNSSTLNTKIKIGDNTSLGNYGAIGFYTGATGASASLHMVLDQNGNVMIGTTSVASSALLTVNGAVSATSFIGSGTQLTGVTAGGVTGGTTNYVPLWTGTNTLGTSAIYQSGSSVGIGTTSPGAALEVRSNSSTGWIKLSTTSGNPWITSTNDIGFMAAGTYPLYLSGTSAGIAVGAAYATGGTASPTNGAIIQGNVGMGRRRGSLDLHNVNDGLNLPYGTTAQRPTTNATNGMIRYNSSLSTVEEYSGGTWQSLLSSGSSVIASGVIKAKSLRVSLLTAFQTSEEFRGP